MVFLFIQGRVRSEKGESFFRCKRPPNLSRSPLKRPKSYRRFIRFYRHIYQCQRNKPIPWYADPNFDTVMKYISFLSIPSAFVFALKHWSRHNDVRSNPNISVMTGPSSQLLSPGRIEPRSRDAPLWMLALFCLWCRGDGFPIWPPAAVLIWTLFGIKTRTTLTFNLS